MSRVAAAERRLEDLRPQLVAIAARVLRRPDAAEDVAQEALLRLMRAQNNGRAVVDERAFAATITVRLAIDRIRSERNEKRRLRRLDCDDGSAGGSPEVPVDVSRLYDAITALPAKQSAVITLRKIMELEYAEIAGILGISVESCRSHCRLGLQRLRRLLNHE